MAKKIKLTLEQARSLPVTHRVQIAHEDLSDAALTNLLAKQEEILTIVRALSEMARHPARELRPFNCTQQDFDKLPGLVSRSTFLYWSGLSDEELSRETKAGHIKVYKPRENGKALYFKRDIARLSGFTL